MKKLMIVMSIILVMAFVGGCSGDKSEKVYKEALKQAEELKKMTMVEKFNKFTNETTMGEARAILGAPAQAIASKLGDTDLTVYLWKDKDGNEVGAAFAGAKLMEKLDKEQIEFFKNNIKQENQKQ